MTRIGLPARISSCPLSHVVRFMSYANSLTLLRILLVPVLVLLILRGAAIAALFTFVVAGLTDLLDGWIARRWRQQSGLGMVLDPLADKFLLVSALLVLSLPGAEGPFQIPLWWLTVTVIGRDLLLVLGALLVHWLRGTHTFPPSMWGKSATSFQLLSVFLVLVSNAGIPTLVPLGPIFVATLALTLISGLHYLSRANHLGDFSGKMPEAKDTSGSM